MITARSEDVLRETQQICLQHTPHVEIVIGDVSQEDHCKEIVDRAVKTFGAIDMLILNAAFSPTPGWFVDMEHPVSQHFGWGGGVESMWRC